MVLYTREDDTAYTVFANALEQIISKRTVDGDDHPRASGSTSK